MDMSGHRDVSGDLNGRIALITGAGGGLGAAIALSFARAGATLALLDLEEASAQATLEASGAKGTAVAADVSDERAVAAAAAAVERDVGPVDVVVNNAGIAGIDGPKPLHETPPDEWARVLAVNLNGPYLVCRSVLPSMIERRAGVIVNVASAAGLVAFAGRSPYVASKAALIHLTRNLAVEYAEYGIRANALCPGWMDTPLTRWRLQDPDAAAKVAAMVPMGRVATPAELAEGALFLASSSSRYMTGQMLVVDGGWTAP
jgi:NAD(P)-dependent dehydrogenase (short-subunit alcohol dehydrogenase family)